MLKEDDIPWKSLFYGESLDGWSVKGGEAEYEVRAGSIVGSTFRNTHNTFLATEKMYEDFILELDFKVDPSRKSGIQIRSNSFENYIDGE